MVITSNPTQQSEAGHAATMRAAVFHGPDDIRVEDVPRPRPVPARLSSE